MTIPFAREVLDATAACDEVMAEPFELHPKTASRNTNEPPQADPARPVVTFMATFRDPDAKPLVPNSYDARTYERPGTQSSQPRIQVTPFEVARTQVVINVGDLVERLADGVIWRVKTTKLSTGGILRAEVNLVG